MKFAQFQSTYKPIPTDVYERTGQELEAKYFKNKQEYSLLRQAMANSKVEDRNIGILAKVTTDVENTLKEVNGKWHYAGNILFDAKDRIINDKELAASMEDYAKSQNAKTELQKKFEDGKIDQDAVSAFYINDKRYNNKAISKDENGQLLNRWNTPTPPPKVDTDKKVLEITTLLTQHKDSLAAGNVQGTPVAEIYENHPALEGYIRVGTATGVDGNKIANAVKAWINSTPEIKQYYNYINDAKVFDAVTEKNVNGEYLQNENGEFIQRDITAKDFRDLGIQVSDNWVTEQNSMIYKDEDGNIVTSSIKGVSPDFKETELYKELLDATGSDKLALQQLYKKALTDMQTDKIVDFSRQFGFKEYHNETLKNERYWFNEKLKQDRIEKASIYGTWMGKAPMIPANIKFNPKEVERSINDLIAKRDSYEPGTAQYNQYQDELTNLQTTHKILRDSYYKTGEGEAYTDDLFSKLMDKIPRVDRKKFNDNREAVIKYITGQSNELGFEYNTNQGVRGTRGIYYDSVQDKLNSLRNGFTDEFTKVIQEGNINLNINTIDFLDKDGGISEVGKNVGEHILSRGDSFTNLGGLTEDGEPMTLDQYYEENEIDKSKYTPIAQFTDHYGRFVIKFVPNNDDVTPLENDARIIIEPNADNKDDMMQELANLVQVNSAGLSNEVNQWINSARVNSIYGKTFEPVYDNLALLESQKIKRTDMEDYWLSNVPFKDKDTGETVFGEFKISFNVDNTVSLYQTDSTHTKSVHRATKTNINDVKLYLYNEYTKESK